MTRAEREALWGWGWDDAPDDSDEYDLEPDETLADFREGA